MSPARLSPYAEKYQKIASQESHRARVLP